jgi:hypothetical protein
MTMHGTLFAPLALAALSLAAPAQDVGSNVSTLEITELAQTEAKTYDDFFGRAILIEFFAYW